MRMNEFLFFSFFFWVLLNSRLWAHMHSTLGDYSIEAKMHRGLLPNKNNPHIVFFYLKTDLCKGTKNVNRRRLSLSCESGGKWSIEGGSKQWYFKDWNKFPQSRRGSGSSQGRVSRATGAAPSRPSMLIPPNAISEMQEKFIGLETQPGTSWLLLQGRGNTEGAPLAKHCSSMQVAVWRLLTHTHTLQFTAAHSHSRSHKFLMLRNRWIEAVCEKCLSHGLFEQASLQHLHVIWTHHGGLKTRLPSV